eukprot:gene10596-14235_t
MDSGMGGGIAVPGTAAGGFNNRAPNSLFRPVGTAAGRNVPPMTSMGRNAPMSRGGALASRAGLTTGQTGGPYDARPMTSVSGAGYQSSIHENKMFDPLNVGVNGGGRGPAPPLAEKSDNSFEDKAKEMEKKVHRLIEASADAVVAKDFLKALEKAKEAGKAERSLCKFRESHNLGDQINLDLTYAICFNLANAYYHNKMYEEALNTYQLIVKNKQYPQSGRLRVNMGNIYYEEKKYPQAIKMYRMALDQIPTTGKELRFRIFRNIGNSFVKLGQFQDAIESYETIMNASPDIQTSFNLMLCYYARGDKELMKRHFIKMLSIPIPGMNEEDEEKNNEDHNNDHNIAMNEQDALKIELQKKVELVNEHILIAARLIAPVIDDKDDWVAGYKWVIDQLRNDYEQVLSNFEIELSMAYIKKRRFEDAIKVLKAFERKETKSMAAVNLSFIYFLEGDYQQAEKHADIAIRSDRYNAKALVNKGNCYYVAGDYGRALECYLEAVGIEADCTEALYNLGLACMTTNDFREAQSAFDKLHTMLPSLPEALFQLGSIYERKGATEDFENAAKTYQLLLNKVPGDPNICCKLGQIYEKLQDDNSACHWHTEAHRYYPVNLNVTSWLGVWYVKREMYEQAIEYFERAALVQPGEVKWRLMVTSCYRRLGDSYKALELYQKIHEDHPENIEALQYLEALCKDLGRGHDEYTKKLEKLRRSQPSMGTQMNGGMTRAGGQQTSNSSQLQRPDRPKPDRVDRPTVDRVANNNNNNNNNNTRHALDDVTDSIGNNEFRASPLAAPRAGGNNNISNKNKAQRPMKPIQDEEDDFGDTDVASFLE